MLERAQEQPPIAFTPARAASIEHQASIRFGAFEVVPGARTLLSWGSPVEIGGRAFDLLLTLLASAGQIVAKHQIMRQVWPTTTVDESNLRFQMTCLRRILGDESRRIKTIPGRGYIFIMDDRGRAAPSPAPPRAGVSRPPIVIIDGDAESRDHLMSLLASAGARVESFATIHAFLAGSEIVQGGARLIRGAALAA